MFSRNVCRKIQDYARLTFIIVAGYIFNSGIATSLPKDCVRVCVCIYFKYDVRLKAVPRTSHAPSFCLLCCVEHDKNLQSISEIEHFAASFSFYDIFFVHQINHQSKQQPTQQQRRRREMAKALPLKISNAIQPLTK